MPSVLFLRMGLPHARGGVSKCGSIIELFLKSSPRTWGCFHFLTARVHGGNVFPTHVGVFLLHDDTARGWSPSSPRTWGCFPMCWRASSWFSVFPTHVGVFPPKSYDSINSFSLPHARGGVSHGGKSDNAHQQSSPRTWGCFINVNDSVTKSKVFPTHVGVFLMRLSAATSFSCLPHARGGVSVDLWRIGMTITSSPRTWGCFSSFQRN